MQADGTDLRRRGKPIGQSIVEFTLMLPVLLIMLSGLVEFGILLNQYLDLIDATREAARFASDDDPVHDPNTGEAVSYNWEFYLKAQRIADLVLGHAGQLELDPATDDLVISVFVIRGGQVVNASADRYPHAFTDDRDSCAGKSNGGEIGWRALCNKESGFNTPEVNRLLGDLGNMPPDTGLVLVEIYYNYHMVLGLPWITAFVPDPVTLHAYAFVPNAASAP